jgi:hypothetical protein
MASESYLEYKKLTIELHNLFAQGKGQSAEANEIRNRMEPPEQNLSEMEQDRLFNLSGDLYMISDDEVKEKATVDFDKQKFLDDCHWGNWDDVLKTLRRDNFPASKSVISILRCLCWAEIGDLDVALLFAEFSTKLKPEIKSYQCTVVSIKQEMGLPVDANEIRQFALFLGCFDPEPAKQIAALRNARSQMFSRELSFKQSA